MNQFRNILLLLLGLKLSLGAGFRIYYYGKGHLNR